MVVRAPLVVGDDGEVRELPSGDKLPNGAVNELIVPTIYGAIQLERQNPADFTVPAGYLTLVARNSDGHLVQKDSSGVVIDLAAVGGGGATGTRTPTVVFGDAVSSASVPVNVPVYLTIPYNADIDTWMLLADVPCTVEIDVWRTIDQTLPDVTDSICNADYPELVASVYATGNVGLWSNALLRSGNIYGFVIRSLTGTPKQITLTLSATNV